MLCKKCGKQLADDATFCTSCGWKTDNWGKEVKRSRNARLSIIAVTIIGAILLTLFFLLFLINI